MASPQELQNRVDHLETILRNRDRADAATKAAAIEAANKTADAKTVEARSQAALAEIETVRRGAWFSSIIKAGDQAAAVDFAAVATMIPKEGWPIGTSPADYAFSGGTVAPADIIDVATTHMGKALAALAPIKQ